jgi:hypothetical protein
MRLLFQDKTFGMKNKKGGKAQKFIAQVRILGDRQREGYRSRMYQNLVLVLSPF